MEREKFDRDKPRVNIAFVGRKAGDNNQDATSVAALNMLLNSPKTIPIHQKSVDLEDRMVQSCMAQQPLELEEKEDAEIHVVRRR